MENKQKTIYDLSLHESLKIADGLNVIRVHGGWIYQNILQNGLHSLSCTNTFVPYDEPLILNTGTIDPLPEKHNSFLREGF